MREQEDTGGGAGETQSHHARRPMNAFLIFCKRHRAVVRDKYPNLENRSITKILGEWWANLDEEEKACYTRLAKQYKDAFFSANPDFKWYKLPAPPLRTLNARAPPERPSEPPPQQYQQLQYSPYLPQPECENRTNNNSTKYDYNRPRPRPPSCDDTPLTMFTPGKLADEAQMGGISRLLSTPGESYEVKQEKCYYFGYTPYSGDAAYLNAERNKPRTKEESIRELQNALSETSRVFEDLDENMIQPEDLIGSAHVSEHVRDLGYTKSGSIDDLDFTKSEPINDKNFTNQEIIDQVVNRRLLKEEPYKTAQDDWMEVDRRSDRSCKGKRYQEFMAMGGLLANKRARRDERDATDYNSPAGWEYTTQDDDFQSPEDSSERESPQKLEAKSPEELKPEEPENEMEEKPFEPADFDLDAKIRALPSLSLEKFQEKKRENKKKKKSSFSIRPKEPPATYGMNPGKPHLDTRREAERWRETVIGSQKRKPRKISITRLEVHSMVNRTGEVKTSPEIKIATEAPHAHLPGMAASAVGGAGGVPVDLFALATLAEVAANTSKMEEGSTPARTRVTPEDPTYQYRV